MSEVKSLCTMCAKPIPEGARKCTECDEFQTLPARVIAGLDLGGLIALVPIATLAFAFLQERIEIASSDIRLALITCSSGGATLFASNVGNRAGLIGDATYHLRDEPPRQLTLELAPDSRLVPGGSARSFALRVEPKISPGGLAPFERRGRRDCRVDITIQTLTFDLRTVPRTVTCDCSATSFS